MFSHLSLIAFCLVSILLVAYLFRINHLLKGVPDEVKNLSGSAWTAEQLKKTYDELEAKPLDYTNELPPRLNRRYVVTGGNGKTSRRAYSFDIKSVDLTMVLRSCWRLHSSSTTSTRNKSAQHPNN